ncbi:MAG: fimbrillin family protein [Clostridium sp.]|nr:fimbrillin family protein [Bacteroides sp.]MCM1197954.1 fimbrillin family protein [Clostridium sp.]
MKTIGKLAAAMAVMSAVACSKDEISVPVSSNGGVKVHFDMNVGGMPVTRTSTSDGADGNRNVSWRNADAVGIYVNGVAPVHQYVYEEQGDGQWKEASSADAIYAAGGQTYSFNAWYPYNSDVVTADGLSLKATVLADQNRIYDSNTGYDLSDVLFAETAGVDASEVSNVQLQFSHAFAMVEILVSGSYVTEAPAQVKLRNVKTSANIDLLSKSVVLDEASAAGNVVMYKVEPAASEDSWLYRAIVPAQTVAKDEMLLEVTLGGADVRTYVFKSPGVTYTQARYRRIEATIGEGKVGLVFPAGSIDSWEPSEELPPVSGEEKPVDLVSISIADLTADSFRQLGDIPNLIHNSTNAAFLKETCWLMSVHNTQADQVKAEIVAEGAEKYISYTSASSIGFSFYKSGLRYHHYADFQPGYYKLKVTARKTAESTATKLSVFIRTDKTMSHPSNDGLYFIGPKEDQNSGRQDLVVSNTEWEVKELYFNFNKAAYSSTSTTTVDGEKVTTPVEDVAGDAEAYRYFDLSIMPNGGIMGFQISDVELVKISEDEHNAQK